MNTLRFCSFLILLLVSPAKGQLEKTIAGTWEGNVDVLGKEITLIFEIDRDPAGILSGTLLAPTQSPNKIRLTQVAFNGRDVTLDAADINGGFTGKLSGNGKSMRGEWAQGGFKLPLTLDLTKDPAKVAAMGRPQLSLGSTSYLSEEVTFTNPNDGYSLSGTLTRPKNPFRPTPGVILLSDSGPHDRDSTILRHKPFLVIADYLTKKGFSVLRFDDRGTGKSGGNYATATTNDLVKDAEGALNYLRTRKEINSLKLGLAGHGAGGMIAPILATQREDVRFVVMMAAPGLKGRETIISQNNAIGKESGASPEFRAMSRNAVHAIFDLATSQNPDLTKLEAIGRQFQADVKTLGPADMKSLAELGAAVKGQMDAIRSPWMIDYLKHDPGPVLEKVRCPVLAICGDRDLQVLSKYHLPEIEAHLKAGGNKHSQVRELKGLNHLFQQCETGLPGEYGALEQTISTRVLKGISDWLISVNRG